MNETNEKLFHTRYEVLVYYAPEEGDITRFGVPDEVRSYKAKESAIWDYENVHCYYYKEVMYYYNGVDADCVVNDINEYLEEVHTKALAWDKLLEYHSEYTGTEDDSQHDWEMRELMAKIMKSVSTVVRLR